MKEKSLFNEIEQLMAQGEAMNTQPLRLIHLIASKEQLEIIRLVHELAEHQAQKGHRISVWQLGRAPLTNSTSKRVAYQAFRRKKQGMGLSRDLVNALDEAPSETQVHLHGPFTLDLVYLTQHLRRLGLTYYYTPHRELVIPVERYFRGFRQQPFAWMAKGVLNGAKAVQLIDQWEFGQMQHLRSIQRHHLIPFGYQTSPTSSGASNERTTLILSHYFQSGVRQSGTDLLLDGFQRYRLEGGTGSLHLIYAPDQKGEIDRIVQSRYLERQVSRISVAADGALEQLLQQSALYLDTRRWGGTARGLLDAANQGVPLLVSAPTAVQSYVTNYGAGLPLHENSVEAIAAALHRAEELFQQGTLRILGENARRFVEEVFNWEEICDQLEVMYRNS